MDPNSCLEEMRVMVTYRWIIKTDDFAKRFMLSPHGSMQAPRDSKKLKAAAIAAFRRDLWQHAPVGSDATAWLEYSDRHGTSTILRYTGQHSPSSRWTLVNVKGDVVHSVLCNVTMKDLGLR